MDQSVSSKLEGTYRNKTNVLLHALSGHASLITGSPSLF